MQYIFKFEAMTTECEVILNTSTQEKANACAKAILTEAKRLEKKYSYYDENSYLSQINLRKNSQLDFETKSILQRALKYYKLSEGYFDITVATIKELYRNEKSKESLHVKKNTLKKYVGCEHINIKKDKIYFDNAFTTIDLGGFVKELAVDNAIDIIKKHKINSALVNFGGDIYALGKKENGSKFRVGVKNPHNTSLHVEQFELENEAMTTSASYERNYKIDETIYSHILSTKERKSEPLSVSIIAPTCVESGVYSTALMLNQFLTCRHKSFIINS